MTPTNFMFLTSLKNVTPFVGTLQITSSLLTHAALFVFQPASTRRFSGTGMGVEFMPGVILSNYELTPFGPDREVAACG
ncbi:MAG: hypothetical protein ABH969_04675 [Pseudomonadota bacterium]